MPIIERIKDCQAERIDIRRDLHPEITFEEKRTADLVAQALGLLGLEVHRGLRVPGVGGALKVGSRARDWPGRRHLTVGSLNGKTFFHRLPN